MERGKPSSDGYYYRNMSYDDDCGRFENAAPVETDIAKLIASNGQNCRCCELKEMEKIKLCDLIEETKGKKFWNCLEWMGLKWR